MFGVLNKADLIQKVYFNKFQIMKRALTAQQSSRHFAIQYCHNR